MNSNETEQQKEPTLEDFDKTAKRRLELLQALQAELAALKTKETQPRAFSGKISTKKNVKLLSSLYELCAHQEAVIRGLLGDMYRAASIVGNFQSMIFTLTTQAKSIAVGLQEKGILTEEELRKIGEEKVLPEAIKAVEDKMKEEEEKSK